jgi:hypothetical protein
MNTTEHFPIILSGTPGHRAAQSAAVATITRKPDPTIGRATAPNTRNRLAASLGLPVGWHVEIYPGPVFNFLRFDGMAIIREKLTTTDPETLAAEILAR